MSNTWRVTFALTILGCATTFTACSSDSDDSGGGGSGGQGGSSGQAGSHTGGSAGAATGGKGGSANAGSGGSSTAGSAGTLGSAGQTTAGAGAGGALETAGAAGADSTAGAAGAADIVFSCGTTTIEHQLCSALVAANCSDPTVCSDCVQERTADEQSFSQCAVCTAEFDRYYQCAITAFEGGHLSDGVTCFDGVGADLSDACGEIFTSALMCNDKAATDKACPTSWP